MYASKRGNTLRDRANTESHMKMIDQLKGEIDAVYNATEKLIKLVDKDKLNWKPATGLEHPKARSFAMTCSLKTSPAETG